MKLRRSAANGMPRMIDEKEKVHDAIAAVHARKCDS